MYCNYMADRFYISRSRYVLKPEVRKQAVMLLLVIILVCFGVISPLYLAIDVVATAAGLIR